MGLMPFAGGLLTQREQRFRLLTHNGILAALGSEISTHFLAQYPMPHN
jgi:hypothetical protein